MTTTSRSPVRHDRIRQAQALMREQGVGAIMVLNHDDYRWFFGFDRTQPRAIIPATGAPALVAFTAEEAELRETVGDEEVMVWGSVGGAEWPGERRATGVYQSTMSVMPDPRSGSRAASGRSGPTRSTMLAA